MIELTQTVIVEGKYDCIRLHSLLDAYILQTNGFGIFRDKQKRALIARLAKTTGIVILTDSDKAGQLIRNHIRSIAHGGDIYNAYIPQILGKERRKTQLSKEGLLGVEGMEEQVILNALLKAGVVSNKRKSAGLTKTDFFEFGLSGKRESAQKRKKLLEFYQLPTFLSANALLGALNATLTREEFLQAIDQVFEEDV